MKKVLFLFVTLFIGQTAFAYNFSAVAPTGQTLYYRLRVGGVGVCYPGSSTSTSSSPWSGYTTPSGALTIPTSVTHNGVTYSVTAIEDYAFSGCSGLISVNIPSSVTLIDDCAFQYCNVLTTVNIPDSVTSIGGNAFYHCQSLTSITIGESVTSIGSWAFAYCYNLSHAIIGKSVTSFGSGAFSYCSGLTTVAFNADSCTFVPFYTTNIFTNCPNITTFTFGDNVKAIPGHLCKGLSSLTSVSIGNSVTSIGNSAFSNCSSLDTVIMLPSTAPVILSGCFSNNSASRKFYIPCGSYNSYYYGSGWSYYQGSLQEPDPIFSITVGVNNTAYGSATNTPVTCVEQTIISAIANNHYHFDHWSNGSTANPDTIILTSNLNITAYFAPNQYTITGMSSDNAKGSVSGSATADYLSTVTLTVTANDGYHFVQWQDGNTQNPRTIIVTGDATYTATFAPDAAPATVTATISQIAATSAYAEIVMGQQTSYFYLIYAPQSIFTQNGLTTDEAIINYVNQNYGSSDRNYNNVSGYMNDLTPNTTYQLVVVPYNSNGEVGMVCWEQFTTLNETDPATVTATISEVTATSAYAEIVMGQQTSYFYLIYAPQSVFTQNGLTTDESIISYVNQNYGSSDRNYNNVSGYMNDLTPNTTYMLVVVPYNSDSEVGTICKKQFTTLNTNGIESRGEETYAVSSWDGRLMVSGAEGENVNIYSIDGRCVYSARVSWTATIDVPSSGTYFVKIGHHPACKVVVIR